MSGEHVDRRSVLKGLGTATVGSIVFGSTVAAQGRGEQGEGFPPSGITTWGESGSLGEGEVSTFTSRTPSGKPKYVGVHFSDGALSNLPYPNDNGKTTDEKSKGLDNMHGLWSKPLNLDFPDNTPEPIKYLGFGWNPQGHPPAGVYTKPHFDLHFYFHELEEIGSVGLQSYEPPIPYFITEDNIAAGQIPTNYQLIEGGAVVPEMGAHLAPEDAPEFNDRVDDDPSVPDDEEEEDDSDDVDVWKKTLIWGAADIDSDDTGDDERYELNFVEPMITLDYFENHLDGVEAHEIAQPDAYPQDGYYPNSYAVRDLGDGGYAVVMQDFEYQNGSDPDATE